HGLAVEARWVNQGSCDARELCRDPRRRVGRLGSQGRDEFDAEGYRPGELVQDVVDRPAHVVGDLLGNDAVPCQVLTGGEGEVGHDASPLRGVWHQRRPSSWGMSVPWPARWTWERAWVTASSRVRSEEHTSELQSRENLVC